MNFPQKLLIFSVLLFVTAANAQNSNPACALKKAQAEMLSGLKNVDDGLLYELDYQYDYDLDQKAFQPAPFSRHRLDCCFERLPPLQTAKR